MVSDSNTHNRERTCGRIKWFNNKAGYGFITVTEGEYQDQDIFVHHSALNVENNNQYKYLVQGEYVEFDWKHTSESNKHEWQAISVTGVKSGKLMCETRNDMRTERNNYRSENGEPSNFRGSGPRDGEEWMLVRKKNKGDGNRKGYWKGNNKTWKGGNPEKPSNNEE